MSRRSAGDRKVFVRLTMNYEKLLSENLKNVRGLNVDRGGMYGSNPFENYQLVNKFNTPYSFPSTPSGQNPFLMNDGTFESALNEHNNGYGLKFGGSGGTGYGNTAVETKSHYGAPIMQSKGGKLKGAALSALTLLAFLFFLNLLQSCLKDQMDAMNPTVQWK